MNVKIKIKIFLLSVIIISCNDQNEPFFSSSDLHRLHLDKIDSFWQGDIVEPVSSTGVLFTSRDDYIWDKAFKNENNSKIIIVTVFDSQSNAIEAMEYRIDNVAISINEGESNNLISEEWWYTYGTVFVNRWNTIIEVYYDHPNFDEIKDLLMETASLIALRIDLLSK